MSDELEKALKYTGQWIMRFDKYGATLHVSDEYAIAQSEKGETIPSWMINNQIRDFINARQEQVKQLKEKLNEYENPTSMNKRIAKSYSDLYNENEQQAEQITALEDVLESLVTAVESDIKGRKDEIPCTILKAKSILLRDVLDAIKEG